MDKTVIGILGATVLVLVGIVAFGNRPDKLTELESSFTGDDATVVSETGVHWHPELTIWINGESQPIPGDIGIGSQYAASPFYNPAMGMTDIHTHEAGSVLHWELARGPVLKGTAKLKAFFEIWGKTFSKEQIFDVKTSDGGTLTLTVNGQPNTEFENYIVRDKDKIEIRYE